MIYSIWQDSLLAFGNNSIPNAREKPTQMEQLQARALKNWSLRKPLHLDCPWLPGASTEKHSNPKIQGRLLWLPSPSCNLRISHTSLVDNLCPTSVPRDLKQASYIHTSVLYTQLGQNLWLKHGNVSIHFSNGEDKLHPKIVPRDLNQGIHIHTNGP